jgi:hypothetical protein
MEFMDGVDWCGAVCLALVIGTTIIGWAQARYGRKENEL